MTVPTKTDVEPKVADVPTCQKTLAALAPFVRKTWRPDVVVNVDAIWKMKTASGSPCPSSVRLPDEIASDEVDLYRPGGRVWPPRLPEMVTGHRTRPAASLYAMVKAASAKAAVGLPTCWVPTTIPGGNPV